MQHVARGTRHVAAGLCREMEEMRRARENMTEEDYVVSNERSEATRELEAFR